ncbi:MAG: hypothetical protein SFW67_00255 [Myxococcaceae bacterium]|nr:hypothetical protein [Myxococcaceae bacterium]
MRWLLMLVLVLSAGCTAKGAVLLTIDANGPNGRLRIPEEVDALVVSGALPDGTSVLDEVTFDMALVGKTFPVTLGVDPGPRTGSRVRFRVAARRGQAEVTSGSADAQIDPRQVTTVSVQLVTD